jgi:hypothetical protein
MSANQIEVPVGESAPSGLDFGGEGPGVLLVHGSGHMARVMVEIVRR